MQTDRESITGALCGSRIDLHMHSTASDGTLSPEEILAEAESLGLQVFALTDHDTFAGCTETARAIGEESDIRFLYGVEFSCRDDEGKYHILGYDFDPEDAGMAALTDEQHKIRLEKLDFRLDFLERTYGFAFSREDREELLRFRNPGKPHIGAMMVQKGYVGSKDEGITR